MLDAAAEGDGAPEPEGEPDAEADAADDGGVDGMVPAEIEWPYFAICAQSGANASYPRVRCPAGPLLGDNAPVAVVEMSEERRMATAGRRRGARQRRPLRRPVLTALGLGAVGCGVAWVFLVKAAIEFGRLARDGQNLAWAFTVAATIGAAACLLLMFVLVARVLVAVGVLSEYKGRRSAGRRAG